MGFIYHIASRAEWQQAQRDGDYRVSTRGKTLEQQGYIHAGQAHQVALVANAIYSADTDLIVLVIDEQELTSPVVPEMVPGSDEPFPHIYGPLNLGAVVRTLPFEPGSDGRFSFAAPSDLEA